MPNKFLNLIHPRYWPTWLGLGILYLVTKLPYTLQLEFGKNLGRISYYLLKRFRRVAEINLKLCFPTLSHQAREYLLKKQFQSLGMVDARTQIKLIDSGKRLRASTRSDREKEGGIDFKWPFYLAGHLWTFIF